MATERHSHWYFGGLASIMATCTTHPLDLLKVTMQTHQEKISAMELIVNTIREQGPLAFYRGISASILRQTVYSTTRFGAYEVGKDYIDTRTLTGKVWLSGLTGMLGGILGSPADMINVRMQNDIKLPPEKRSGYKNAVDGLIKAYRQKGFRNLFRGGTTTTIRGGFMNIGQIAFYDQCKSYLLNVFHFADNLATHFTASVMAGTIATTITHPIDVLKTRTMNAKHGEFSSMWHLIQYTAQLGPRGFFKGYVPAFLRLVPQTILTFIFLEQLRLNFGYEKTTQTFYRV